MKNSTRQLIGALGATTVLSIGMGSFAVAAGAQDVSTAQTKRAEPTQASTPEQQAEQERAKKKVEQPVEAQPVEAQPVRDPKNPGEPKRDQKVDIKGWNECYIKRGEGAVTSYFSYDLGSPAQADLAAGSAYNFFSGSNLQANAGQPDTFYQGNHSLAFAVTWNSNQGEPTWFINGQSVTAKSSGKNCKEEPAVPEFPFAIVGPIVAVLAVGGWFVIRRRSQPAVADAAV